MCLIAAHAHALERIKELEAQLVEPPKPDIVIREFLTADILNDIQPLKLKMMFPAPIDSSYFYTPDWPEVFDYIYFRYPMPKYITDRMDCDDFAILIKGLLSSLFGLNYCAVVFGQALGGYHAWNLLRDDQGLIAFEPQTGEFNPDGYIPEYILI